MNKRSEITMKIGKAINVLPLKSCLMLLLAILLLGCALQFCAAEGDPCEWCGYSDWKAESSYKMEATTSAVDFQCLFTVGVAVPFCLIANADADNDTCQNCGTPSEDSNDYTFDDYWAYTYTWTAPGATLYDDCRKPYAPLQIPATRRYLYPAWSEPGVHAVQVVAHDKGHYVKDTEPAPMNQDVLVLPNVSQYYPTAEEILDSKTNSCGCSCQSCAGGHAPLPKLNKREVKVQLNVASSVSGPGLSELSNNVCKRDKVEVYKCWSTGDIKGPPSGAMIFAKYWNCCGELSYYWWPNSLWYSTNHGDEQSIPLGSGTRLDFELANDYGFDARGFFEPTDSFTLVYPDGHTKKVGFTDDPESTDWTSETSVPGYGTICGQGNASSAQYTLPNGDVWTYGLDEKKRVHDIRPPGYDPTKPHTIVAYDDSTAGAGNISQVEYVDSSESLDNQTNYYYQSDGRLSHCIAGSRRVDYVYDDQNNKITVTESSADDPSHLYSETVYDYGASDSISTTVTRKKNPGGDLSAEDQSTKYTFDGSQKNYVISVTDPCNNRTAYTRDSNHLVKDITDPLGMTVTYDRNSDIYHTLSAVTYTPTTGQAYHEEYTYLPGTQYVATYDSLHPTNIVTAHGTRTLFERNLTDKSKVTAIKIAPPSNGNPVWGNAIATFDYYGANETAGREGQLKQITVPKFDDSQDFYMKFEYVDINGKNWDNPTKITYPCNNATGEACQTISYDSFGNPESSKDARGREIQTVFDLLGRLKSTTYTADAQATNTYGCCGLDVATDEDNREVHFVYDDLSRLETTFVKHKDSTSDQSVDTPLVKNIYDSLGNIEQTDTRASGNDVRTMMFNYDRNNRLTDVFYPENIIGSESVGYDAVGHMAWHKQDNKDGTYKITAYHYDTFERLDGVYYDYPNNRSLSPLSFAGLDPDVTIHYNGGSGQVSQIDDSTGHSYFWYNDLGQLIRYTPSGHEPSDYMIAYTYNGLGEKSSIKIGHPNPEDVNYPDPYDPACPDFAKINVIGLVYDVEYKYFANGWLRSVATDDGTTLIAQYQYDDAGNCKKIAYGNVDIDDAVDYTEFTPNGDPRYFNSQITLHYKENGAKTSTIIGYPDRDKSGNPETMSDWTGDWTYTYDDATGRLKSAHPDGGLTTGQPSGGDYKYDWVGNRLDPPYSDGNHMAYNAADQLTSWPGMYDYSYYPNGSLHELKTPDGTIVASYQYGPDGLMTEADYLGKTMTNTWDFSRNRVGMNINGGTYAFVYDRTADIPAVLEEVTPNGTIRYFREPSGTLIGWKKGEDWRFYHYDELGSTRILTDVGGNVTDRYVYDAYGHLLNHSGMTNNNPYQYAGAFGYYTHYQDPDFQLIQTGVRFYDSQTGRFMQQDPAADGFNSYQYVDGNPIVGLDPLGMWTWGPQNNKPLTKALCKQLHKMILDKIGFLKEKIGNYDPVKDYEGGCKYQAGGVIRYSKPLEHYRKITKNQDILRDMIDLYLNKCGGPGNDPVPVCEPVLEPVPVPHPAMPDHRITLPDIDWKKVGIGVGVVGTAVGIIFAPEITVPVLVCAAA